MLSKNILKINILKKNIFIMKIKGLNVEDNFEI